MTAFPNDNAILQGLQAGNENAFNQVYHSYVKPLCYFAEKITGNGAVAQDMVAESFVKLLQRKPVFESLASLKSFLYVTTRNGCFDYLRTEKKHRQSHQQILLDAKDSEEVIENHIIRTEVLSAIYMAIQTLPEKYKQVVKLALIEGKNNDEIVAETGMAYQTVRNHKSEGIKLLRLAIFRSGNLSDLALVYCFMVISQHLR